MFNNLAEAAEVRSFISRLTNGLSKVSKEANDIYITDRMTLARLLGNSLSKFQYSDSAFALPDPTAVANAKAAITEAYAYGMIIDINDSVGMKSTLQTDNRREAIPESTNVTILLEGILAKFPYVVKVLNDRPKNRPAFEVANEYDVQDLLRALLIPHIKDLRKEEPTPSFAGRSARIDLVLKDEKIVLEVKMTRDGLGLKEIRTQLIEDIETYKTHSDYRTFVGFIYDPGRNINNPGGIKADLEGMSNDRYKVIIAING